MIHNFKNFKKHSLNVNESNSNKITFINGKDEVDVNILNDKNEVTFDEVKRILKLNKFNDDKFGQFSASYEGIDDEDPYWIFVEDVNDDEEFEMFDDYDFFYINPSGNTKIK